MYYCIYVSSASNPLADRDLMNIKEKTKTSCEKAGVTGLLVFHRNTFIHYYEGKKTSVSKLIAAISKDKQHKNVKVVSEGKIDERQFQTSSMELRVLDKDPLFTASELENDSAGVKKLVNDCFMSIT